MQRAEIIGVACRKGQLGVHRERTDSEYLCTIVYSPDDYLKQEELQNMASDLCLLVKTGEREAFILAKKLLTSDKRDFSLLGENKTNLIMEIYTKPEQQEPIEVRSTLIYLTNLCMAHAEFKKIDSKLFASSRERYIGKAVYETSEGLERDPIAVSTDRTEDADRLASCMCLAHPNVPEGGYVTVIAVHMLIPRKSGTKCSIS
jgi:hypothetical protein